MKLFSTYEDGIITIQPKDYIEDGWYIEIDGGDHNVYEIPEGGGDTQYMRRFDTLHEAMCYVLGLC